MTVVTPLFIGYPPAPSNGGALSGAPPKLGEWVWQPKVDDWRGVLHLPTLRVWNQYGEESAIYGRGQLNAVLFKFAALNLPRGWEWFDIGIMRNRHDMMHGSIIVFDVMDSSMIHCDRRIALEDNFEELPLMPPFAQQDALYVVAEWRHLDLLGKTPLMLEASLKETNARIGQKFYEGLVAKRADAIYPIAFRAKTKTPIWVKHRFDQ